MPKYTVDYLYNEFSQLAGMRTDSKYANDAGYWTGGRCDWGGSHNLREDCGTLAKGFEKMESLDGKQITDELTNTANKGEFDFKKSTLLQKINEISSGLQARTGYSSSMFGVCIIWADQAMSPYVENKMQDCRRSLENLKSQLGTETYQWVEELKRLELEIRQIEQKMKENQQKALRETDPIKKQALIAEIESDGKLLQQKYREHQEHSNKFRFDPSKHVSDMINGMKKAIERSNKGGSGGSGGNPNKPRKPNVPNDPFGGSNNGNRSNNLPDGNDSNRTPRKRNQPEKSNQQMLLLAIAVIVVLFFLMNQKSDHSRYPDYDY